MRRGADRPRRTRRQGRDNARRASTSGIDRPGRGRERPIIELAFNRQRRVSRDWLDRVADAAQEQGRSGKTVIRRVDATLTLLVAALIGPKDEDDQKLERNEKVPLKRLREILEHVGRSRTLLQDVSVEIFADHVDVREVREVEAIEDGVEYYVVGKTFPWRARA